MPQPLLRRHVERKLADGLLPLTTITRAWGGTANGEMCDACDEIITSLEFVLDDAPPPPPARALQFHVECFHVWEEARLRHVASLLGPPEERTARD